ncbi:hypothetical protein Z043_105675, partial [Scleropages formosus]
MHSAVRADEELSVLSPSSRSLYSHLPPRGPHDVCNISSDWLVIPAQASRCSMIVALAAHRIRREGDVTAPAEEKQSYPKGAVMHWYSGFGQVLHSGGSGVQVLLGVPCATLASHRGERTERSSIPPFELGGGEVGFQNPSASEQFEEALHSEVAPGTMKTSVHSGESKKENDCGELEPNPEHGRKAGVKGRGHTQDRAGHQSVIRHIKRDSNPRPARERDPDKPAAPPCPPSTLEQFTVSDHNLDSPEPGPMTGLEPFMVRRLSGRSVQLPPLVFRQAEQYYCERKTEPEHIPTRPTTLPLRTPPLIAITTTDSSRVGGRGGAAAQRVGPRPAL